MTSLSDRLAEAQAKSAKLYVQRTQIEEHKQSLQNQMQHLVNQGRAVDIELYKTDSQIDLLKELSKEANG
jgi:uncharacterized protein (DUF3084 family)